jgi:hypothetical protein
MGAKRGRSEHIRISGMVDFACSQALSGMSRQSRRGAALGLATCDSSYGPYRLFRLFWHLQAVPAERQASDTLNQACSPLSH